MEEVNDLSAGGIDNLCKAIFANFEGNNVGLQNIQIALWDSNKNRPNDLLPAFYRLYAVTYQSPATRARPKYSLPAMNALYTGESSGM